jgi:hypothetical protein
VARRVESENHLTGKFMKRGASAVLKRTFSSFELGLHLKVDSMACDIPV